MPKQLAVVMIHGIGRQRPDYAAHMIRNIEQQLVVRGYEPDTIAWQPVYWDDILAPAEKAYLERSLDTASLRAHRLRELVVTVLGDATGYRQLSAERVSADELRVYRVVHERIQQNIATLYHDQLGSHPVPMVVLAHSFGGHILSNYVWDSQRRPQQGLSAFERMNWLTGIITFGCNIPLFTFACPKIVPISFPPPRLAKRLKPKARWLNYYDPDDVLAWPLKSVNAAYARVVSDDRLINVGGAVIGRTPFSHLRYWPDRGFAREVAAFLVTLL